MAEGNKEKLNIRLHLYDTDFSIYVFPEEEEAYRKAGRLITEVVNRYADAFKARKSDKEILYMAMLEISVRYQNEIKRNDTAPFVKMIEKLTNEISSALKEK